MRLSKRRLAWQVSALIVAFGLAAYFGYHTVWGRYGLEARSELASRATVLDFEAATLRSARDALERDIALLKTEPPHPDIVDELARDLLGYAAPSDRLVRTR